MSLVRAGAYRPKTLLLQDLLNMSQPRAWSTWPEFLSSLSQEGTHPCVTATRSILQTYGLSPHSEVQPQFSKTSHHQSGGSYPSRKENVSLQPLCRPSMNSTPAAPQGEQSNGVPLPPPRAPWWEAPPVSKPVGHHKVNLSSHLECQQAGWPHRGTEPGLGVACAADTWVIWKYALALGPSLTSGFCKPCARRQKNFYFLGGATLMPNVVYHVPFKAVG